MKLRYIYLLTLMSSVAWGVCPIDPGETLEASQKKNVENLNRAVDETPFSSEELIYQELKEKFLHSDFCNPLKIEHQPEAKVSPFFIKGLTDAMRSKFTKYSISLSEKMSLVDSIQNEFDLNEKDLTSARALLRRASESASGTGLMPTVAMGIILQLVISSVEKDPEKAQKRTLQQLVDANIFESDQNSKAICPFLSKDAFLKGYEGFQKIKSSKANGITNSRYLTIVDYTKPSNQRRLFVFDLQSKDVVNNTWVAQGGGVDSKSREGADGLGSNPKFSNVNGSGLSSDGFIIADAKPTPSGKFEGDRILLTGIDLKNTAVRSPRAIEIHSHGTPGVAYLNDPKSALKTFQEQKLPLGDDNVFLGGSEKIVSKFIQSVSYENTLPATEGCLGVPLYELENKPGKLGSQIPGGVIFSYSGPKMTSKYFE